MSAELRTVASSTPSGRHRSTTWPQHVWVVELSLPSRQGSRQGIVPGLHSIVCRKKHWPRRAQERPAQPKTSSRVTVTSSFPSNHGLFAVECLYVFFPTTRYSRIIGLHQHMVHLVGI